MGALLHELLDGKKFRSEYDDGQELFAAVISGEVGPLSRPVPRELDELRIRLLAPDPADRIQTAEEAIGWLQRYPGYGDGLRVSVGTDREIDVFLRELSELLAV